MLRVSSNLVLASLVAVGCNPQPVGSLAAVEATIDPVAVSHTSKRPSFQRFDFGLVLSQDELLRHTFTIENPSNGTVRIVQATTLSPCCSAIEDHPGQIDPGGSVAIPVVMKPGHRAGGKLVSFLIETDQSGRNQHLLELLADLRPEWEVIPESSNSRAFALGVGGTLGFTIVSRRCGGAGLLPPDTIEVADSYELTNDRDRSVLDQVGTMTESRRPIVVHMPPAARIGLNRATLRFGWRDGSHRDHDFAWEVKPAVQVSPSILIFSKEEKPRDCPIVLTAERQPVRILAVTGSALAEMPQLPSMAGLVQRLDLKVDPSRIDPHGADGMIRIRTDHAEVVVKVMLLGGPEKQGAQ